MDVDPITLAVVEGALQSTIREMREVVVRSGRSPIISISTDFSNSIFDTNGEQVIQSYGQPVHIGSMQVALGEVRTYWGDDISPGDVIFVNDPTYGGGHQADMSMFKPIFIDDDLFAWAGCRCHVSDSGGPVAGGYNPLATQIYGEGLRMPPIKIYDRGRVRSDVVDLILLNVRTPRAFRGDMGAQYGALGVAERRLEGLCNDLGADVISRSMSALLQRGEQMTKEAIRALPQGEVTGSAFMEDPFGGSPLPITCTLLVGDGRLRVVVRSGPQISAYKNSYFGNSISAVYAGLLTGLPMGIPRNGGTYRRFEVDLGPKGTITNAESPAPCSLATSNPFDNITEAVQDALSKLVPERAMAGWTDFAGAAFAGVDPRVGEQFSHLSSLSGTGGAGAMWETDGWSCCGAQAAFGGMRTGNVEELELQVPIRIHRFELAPNTEGPGRWRGGFGVDVEIEPLGPIAVSTVGEGYELAPPGRFEAAEVGPEWRSVFTRFVREPDGSTRDVSGGLVFEMDEGQVLVSRSTGGGGIGDPKLRSRVALERDVASGLIDRERARTVYGWEA